MKKYLILPIFMSLLFSSCNDYLDINNNPNDPSEIALGNLLTYAQKNMAYAFSAGSVEDKVMVVEMAGIGQDLGVYMHQITTREDADEYNVTGNEWFLNRSWMTTYSYALKNIEDIIQQGTVSGDLQYVGIAKIMKAYVYSVMVDLYVDVPYSEVGSGFYPKYDKGEDIYTSLFTLINEGIDDLEDEDAENLLVPGTDDIIYGGDAELWIKAAKTLKLKMLNQVRLVRDVKTDITALLSEGDLIEGFEESFIFKFGTSLSPDERNPAYVGTYAATQKSQCISPWFYEILKGYNPNIFTSITDPRIPYYFYNQLTPDAEPREGNNSEYRDGGFVSIYFGSKGPDRDHSQDKSLTVVGIYPAGGLYDDGGGKVVTTSSSTGAAPFRMITNVDRLYIEAELIQVGIISGDVKAKLQEAIEGSFAQVDAVVKLVGNTQSVPKLAGSDVVKTYLNKIMAEFDNASPEKKLEIIMTQKWISSFGNSTDQYTDYRRTGYPVLFDPNNSQMAPGGYVTPPAGGDPTREAPPVRVSCSKSYPLSLPWSNDDLQLNGNAPTQKENLSTYKVFWDN